MPEVIQDEGREDDEAPAGSDRLLAEVTHVRIEGFGSRDREEDRAGDNYRQPGMIDEEADGFQGIEGTGDDRGLGWVLD